MQAASREPKQPARRALASRLAPDRQRRWADMVDDQRARPDFSGMTVNERLFTADLTDAFDAAVRRRDRARMVELLRAVAVEDAESSADAVLADPKRYGY